MKYYRKSITLILALLLMTLFGACSGKKNKTETNVTTDSHVTVEQNTTTGTGDNNTTGGGTDDNITTGGNDDNSTTEGTDDNATTGGDNDNNTISGGGSDDNITTGGGTDDNTTTGGNDDNTTTGGGDDNTTTTPTVTLKSLNLTVDKTALNKDENTTVKVMATYSNNTTKEVTDKVEWIVVPSDAAKMTNVTLTALKDKATTLKAKLNGKTSNAIDLNITWVVDGHTLPPEPDKALNDSTLLGIDTNDNGVRDDVERWIYEEYKDKHPIHINIAMQAARGYKLVLETPERAKEIRLKVNGALFCGWYYQKDAYRYNDPTLVHERIDTKVFSKYFNTKERSDTYWQYDRLLSGDVYDLPRSKQRKALCDFNTSKYGK